MREVRLHLWDIFVFAGVGAFLFLILLLYHACYARPALLAVGDAMKDVPSAAVVIGLLALFTLTGVLIEPIANGFAQLVNRGSKSGWLRWLRLPSSDNSDARAMEDYIKKKYTSKILTGGSPFMLCKDFVETNGLSTTFMPFLAKFGFYRSVSFICFVCFGWFIFGMLMGWYRATDSTLIAGLSIYLSRVYFGRSVQFYSYQARAVYAAFLVPELSQKLGMGGKKLDGLD